MVQDGQWQQVDLQPVSVVKTRDRTIWGFNCNSHWYGKSSCIIIGISYLSSRSDGLIGMVVVEETLWF